MSISGVSNASSQHSVDDLLLRLSQGYQLNLCHALRHVGTTRRAISVVTLVVSSNGITKCALLIYTSIGDTIVSCTTTTVVTKSHRRDDAVKNVVHRNNSMILIWIVEQPVVG